MALLDLYMVAENDFQADFEDATFVFRVYPTMVSLIDCWPKDRETRARACDALAAVVVSRI